MIPKNYFPEKRLPSAPRNSPDDKTYNGDWDGTFKEAWSDNPAWIFYDLLINNRYGLGSHVDVHKIDKWTLYKIGRYCDAVDEEGYFIGVDDTYSQNEKEPRLFRRSIFVSENIKKNDKISEKNIKVVRPAHGLHPIYKKYLIGKKLKFSLKKGTPLKLSHLDVKRVPKLI